MDVTDSLMNLEQEFQDLNNVPELAKKVLNTLKRNILDVSAATGLGTYDNVHELVGAIRPDTKTPKPAKKQQKLNPWSYSDMESIINKLIQDSDGKLKLINADLATLNLVLNLKVSGTIPKGTMFALSTGCMTTLWNTHKGTMRINNGLVYQVW